MIVTCCVTGNKMEISSSEWKEHKNKFKSDQFYISREGWEILKKKQHISEIAATLKIKISSENLVKIIQRLIQEFHLTIEKNPVVEKITESVCLCPNLFLDKMCYECPFYFNCKFERKL